MEFVKGLIIGFSIAAPVGPIGILCIQRTLTGGKFRGLATGLGAATADGLYGSIAGFGLAFLSDFLISQQSDLQLVGGIFLIFLGLRTWLTKPLETGFKPKEVSLVKAYASSFLLTLTNPMTILSFTAIFAGLGLHNSNRAFQSAALLVFGVFLGSALWWFLLSFGVNLFRTMVSDRQVQWINKLSGIVLILFGVLSIVNIV